MKKIIAFFKLITPWIKFSIVEFRQLMEDIRIEKEKAK